MEPDGAESPERGWTARHEHLECLTVVADRVHGRRALFLEHTKSIHTTAHNGIDSWHMVNAYMSFCARTRSCADWKARSQGLSIGQQGSLLGELYRASKEAMSPREFTIDDTAQPFAPPVRVRTKTTKQIMIESSTCPKKCKLSLAQVEKLKSGSKCPVCKHELDDVDYLKNRLQHLFNTAKDARRKKTVGTKR